MNANPTPYRRLDDVPLWRLLVALDDAEHTFGPRSETARTLAEAVRERLSGADGDSDRQGKAVRHAD
jgi:hypothetical protein